MFLVKLLAVLISAAALLCAAIFFAPLIEKPLDKLCDWSDDFWGRRGDD